MLLLLDVGNTSVTYGFYKGGRFLSFGSEQYVHIPKLVKKCSLSGGKSGSCVVVSSVVPQITRKLRKLASGQKGLKIWVVGQNLKLSIRHKYRPAKNLGADRLVNIYGALRMYRPPFLIIDFGTAVTFDYVSKSSVFEGGMIIPGPEIAFQALLDRAALIPKKLRLPENAGSFLGTSTYECMKTGILQGFGSMTDELIARFRKRCGRNLRVLSTGGFARHLKPYSRSLDHIDPKHLLKSLLIIYKDKQSGRL